MNNSALSLETLENHLACARNQPLAAFKEAEKAYLGEIFTSYLIPMLFSLKYRLHTEIKLITNPFRNESPMRLTCFFTTFSPDLANCAFGQ